MNLILGLIAFITCVIGGAVLSTKYTERKNFYIDAYNFNAKLITEVSFSKNTVIETLKEEKNENKRFYVFVDDYFNGLQVSEIKFLDSTENDYLNNYIKNIGKSDSATQKEYLDYAAKYFDEKQKNAIEEERKYKNLYVKLGFLIGLILFIALL